MLLVLVMVIVFSFSIYLSIEAMKNGMCEKKWFIAAMCLGPVIWPMFNVKRQMLIRKNQGVDGVQIKA